MAKVGKKAWLWPCLPGFTRSHFPDKLGQKPGKPGLACLFQAGRVFGRAPDARVIMGKGPCVAKILLYRKLIMHVLCCFINSLLSLDI